MKYFEIIKPYYALIKAENEEKAIDTYVETVSDYEEDEFKIEEISKETAWEKLKEAKEGFRSLEELETEFSTEEDSLLLIDGSLI